MTLWGSTDCSIIALGSLAPAHPCWLLPTLLSLMTLLGTGNLIKSVDGILSCRPSIPLPGQSLGTQWIQIFLCCLDSSTQHKHSAVVMFAPFLRMSQNSTSRSPVLWDFPVDSEFAKVEAGIVAEMCQWGSVQTAGEMSQLCPGSSFLMKFELHDEKQPEWGLVSNILREWKCGVCVPAYIQTVVKEKSLALALWVFCRGGAYKEIWVVSRRKPESLPRKRSQLSF